MDSVKRVIFGEGITGIRADSFKHAERIESVEFPSTLESIDGEAFCGCKGLKEITIPENTASIGSWAFDNCNDLAAVTILSRNVTFGETPFGYTDIKDETDHYMPVENFTLIGYKGSTAEEYANKHINCGFVDIEHMNAPVKLGDVNDDGKINSADITKTAAHIKGMKTLSDSEKARADVNGDSKINSADITKIAAHIKGLKTIS